MELALEEAITITNELWWKEQKEWSGSFCNRRQSREGTSQSRVAFFAQMLLRRMNLVHARISHSTLLPPTSEFSIHMQLYLLYPYVIFYPFCLSEYKWVTLPLKAHYYLPSLLSFPMIPPSTAIAIDITLQDTQWRTAEGFHSRACPHRRTKTEHPGAIKLDAGKTKT